MQSLDLSASRVHAGFPNCSALRTLLPCLHSVPGLTCWSCTLSSLAQCALPAHRTILYIQGKMLLYTCFKAFFIIAFDMLQDFSSKSSCITWHNADCCQTVHPLALLQIDSIELICLLQ